MDRDQIAQTVALLVVAAVFVRWVPVAGGSQSWLGAGAALEAWKVDAMLESEAGGGDRGLALLRAGNPAQLPRTRRLLAITRELQARTPVDARIQTKGLSRNEGWILRYDLYPRRVTWATREEGSRVDDATQPDVDAVVIGAEIPRVEYTR